MLTKLLIPVDFSELASYVREVALKIAQRSGAELHLLHVIPIPSHILKTEQGDLFDDGEMDLTPFREQKAKASEKLAAWTNYANVHTCICFGHVNEETVKYSKQHQIDLILMATHGATGMKELVTGSHGEYVAMHANAPVLTLKCERPDLEFRNVLLAGAFTDDDIPHCEALLELAGLFEARFHLVRINTPRHFLPDHQALAHMEAFCSRHGIENATLQVYNSHDVEEGIIRYASDKEIDLIAIGSMQRTGLSKFIHGCVSADLVNHVYKPLLTFKLKD
jgi:nucleotide-binding universal stress UspA family protein